MRFDGNISMGHFGRPFGRTDEEENNIKNYVREKTEQLCGDIKADRIDFYNMNAEKHCYNAGTKKRLIFFCNATHVNVEGEKEEHENVQIGRAKWNKVSIFNPLKNDETVILSKDGTPIAEYFYEENQINILFDIFEEGVEVEFSKEAIDFILKKANEMIADLNEKESQWGPEKNKEKLLKVFEDSVLSAKKRQLEEDRKRIEQLDRDVESSKRNLTALIRRRTGLVESLESADENNIKNMAKVIEDFNLIVKHKKVKSLSIDEKILTVKTVPLYITSDRGKRYYGGNYKLQINMENSDVRFFGDNPRGSYWTGEDPHPHVSGRDGHACLGNIAETIAELCAGFQVYALVMICIDFLESANTSDAAGKNVIRWDEVDENGNEVQKKKVRCPRCENEYDEADMVTVYEATHEGEPTGVHAVCQDCRDEFYDYDDDCDEYIRN